MYLGIGKNYWWNESPVIDDFYSKFWIVNISSVKNKRADLNLILEVLIHYVELYLKIKKICIINKLKYHNSNTK